MESGTITITSASPNMTTFDLYSDVDGYTTAFANNISKDQLLSGYQTNNVPNNTQNIKINPNTGPCVNNYIIVPFQGAPAIASPTPTQTSTPPVTPTLTPTPTTEVISYNYYLYDVTRYSIPNATGGYFNYINTAGESIEILQDAYGYVGRYCMREDSYLNNQYNLYEITYAGICMPSTPTPTPTPKASYFGIIRTTAPVGPADCTVGGITYDGTQAVWEFQSSTNSVTTSSVVTDFPGSSYNTLSQFNLIQGHTYYLCDSTYGWTSFVYNGANSITLGTLYSCPVSYEFAVYTGNTLSGAGGVCTFHSAAVSYVNNNGGTLSEYYYGNGGFYIITTQNNNNTLSDSYNPYYALGNPVTTINGDGTTYWIGTDGVYGTFDSSGNFSFGGQCGGNGGNGGGGNG